MNIHPPKFERSNMRVSVDEDAPLGASVVALSATDSDNRSVEEQVKPDFTNYQPRGGHPFNFLKI